MDNVKYPNIVTALVDDQKTCLSLLERHIIDENLFSRFNIYCFQNPFECLKVVKKNKIHLLVTDFCMPVITGDMLIIELKKLCPDVKAILFSSRKVKNCINTKLDMKNFADIIMEKVSFNEKHILINNINKLCQELS